MNLAPIVIFVYNRLDHTRQTVEALQKNELANESNLFIFSDAPKKLETAVAVCNVRKYLKTITGFRSVSIIERDRNLGLANSVIDGITQLCAEHGRVIVLEDDLVVSPVFLNYMNTALERYFNAPKVMQISGNMFPVSQPERLPETFFCRATTTWGWATWDRAWEKFEPNAQKLVSEIINRKMRKEFDMGGEHFQMLLNQKNGAIDSWGIRWYASVFLAGGLCLHPSKSLVRNIGHDGSGVHCASSNLYETALSAVMPKQFPEIIEELRPGREALERFFKSIRTSIWICFKSRVKATMLRHLVNLS